MSATRDETHAAEPLLPSDAAHPATEGLDVDALIEELRHATFGSPYLEEEIRAAAARLSSPEGQDRG